MHTAHAMEKGKTTNQTLGEAGPFLGTDDRVKHGLCRKRTSNSRFSMGFEAERYGIKYDGMLR